MSTPEVRQTIGKYVIERRLGAGNMGTVYLGYDSKLDRRAAIKVMKTGLEDETLKSRFLTEARAIAKLDHPNIIRIWDFDTDGNSRPYIAMEYIEGEDLKTFIEKKLFLSLEQKLRIMIDVCKGLNHAHENHIIHRDIKPGNIRINGKGEAKILDFGLARFELAESTLSTGPIGSPYYMSPEQWNGVSDLDRRSDVFSVASVFYEFVSYVRPFEAENISVLKARIISEPHVPLLQVFSCTPALSESLDRALAKDRESRFSSCIDFAHAIEGFQSSLPVQEEEARKQMDFNGADRVRSSQGSRESQELEFQTSIVDVDEESDYDAPVRRHESQEHRDSLAGKRADGAVNSVPPAPVRIIWAYPAAVLAVLTLVLAGFYYIDAPRRLADRIRPTLILAIPPVMPRVIQTTTGEMVLIPAGKFSQGPTNIAEVLPAFYIDRTEVTNAAFEVFVKETDRPRPDGVAAGLPDYPVVNITIDDAKAFARWAGKRLPTLKEWEKAARGIDGRAYPWGNQSDMTLANVAVNNYIRRSVGPADSFQAGDSPWGVRQMVGNVWELIDQVQHPSSKAVDNFRPQLTPPATEDETWYIMMGGSARDPLIENAAFDFASVPGRFQSDRIGFRCVRDVDQ